MHADERFQRKTLLVDRGERRLGEALARKMSAAGAELILSARDETKLNEIVESLPQKARALLVMLALRRALRRQ